MKNTLIFLIALLLSPLTALHAEEPNVLLNTVAPSHRGVAADEPSTGTLTW